MSFAAELEKHVERLGIAGALSAFADAGDAIGRRTLEQWRAGRVPRVMIQRGALAILSAARTSKPKRPPGKSNTGGQTCGPAAPAAKDGTKPHCL